MNTKIGTLQLANTNGTEWPPYCRKRNSGWRLLIRFLGETLLDMGRALRSSIREAGRSFNESLAEHNRKLAETEPNCRGRFYL